MPFPHSVLPALPPHGSKARKMALLLLGLAPFLIGALALYLGQDKNWDLRNYHWYNAYAFLNDRYAMDLLPSQVPTFYNPLLDVPFFLLANAVSAKMAGFILGTVQGLNIILIFMLCHATLIIPNAKQKVLVCFALALLGMLGGGGMGQIGTTFYDNITSLGLFSSALMVIRFYPRLAHAPWGKVLFLAFLCGFPAGVMMGLKLPFVIFCVGMCGAFLFVTGSPVRRLWLSFGFGLGVLAGLVLAEGHWAWHLYQTTGNPLFPYFNDVFANTLFPPVSGRDIQFVPGRWDHRLFFPFIITDNPFRTGEVPWRDLRLPILYVLLPLCALIRLAYGRNKLLPDRLAAFYATRYLLWMAILSYLVWLFVFAIYRYAVPLEMIAPLLIVIAMGMLPMRPAPRTMLTVFVLLIIAASIRPADWGRMKPWMDTTISVTHPPIENPSETMLLMAGFEPYSHVIPAFPPAMPVVRVQSNLTSPEEDKGINKLIRQRVEAHKGPFKLLIPKYQYGHAETALGHFGLTFSPQKCQAVDDDSFESQLMLCDVTRTSNPVKKP